MTIQKVIDYCLNTPKNINPAILESMIRELMEKGETSVFVNGVNYKKLSDAITAAEAGAEIVLSEDVKEEKTTEISKDLIINLNGNKISSEDKFPIRVTNEATLTIIGNKDSVVEGNIVVGKGNGSNGHLVIDGGTYVMDVPKEAPILTNGSCNNSSVTIKNAKVKSADVAAYLPAGGKYVFENCELEGATGLYIKSGNVELINCTIKATGEQFAPVPNGNGGDTTGDGIILDSKQGYNGNMSLTIKGNSVISSENGYAIHEALTDLATSATVALAIEDGKFSGKKYAFKASEAFDAGVAEDKISCEIAGGVYSSLIDEKYLAEGKECVSNGIKFIVK